MTVSIYLAKGRDKALRRRHPWIFSRGIDRIDGKAELGETVEIYANNGEWLARGAFSPQSQIRARVWTFDKNEAIDKDFFVRKLNQAQALRDVLAERDGLTGYRLIAAESDGLPGITIDRYQDYFVCQLLSAGAEATKDLLVEALVECYPDCNIYERSDVSVRKKKKV